MKILLSIITITLLFSCSPSIKKETIEDINEQLKLMLYNKKNLIE